MVLFFPLKNTFPLFPSSLFDEKKKENTCLCYCHHCWAFNLQTYLHSHQSNQTVPVNVFQNLVFQKYMITSLFSINIRDFFFPFGIIFLYWHLQLHWKHTFSLLCWVFILFLASLIAQLVKNPPEMQKTLVQFLGWEDLLEKEKATHSSILGLPLWLSWWRICLQSVKPGFNPWVGKIPWRSERLPIPVFCPGEFYGLYSPWGHKESDTTEWLSHFTVLYPTLKYWSTTKSTISLFFCFLLYNFMLL